MCPLIDFSNILASQFIQQQHQTAYNSLSNHHVVFHLQALSGMSPSGQNSLPSSLTHPVRFSSFPKGRESLL